MANRFEESPDIEPVDPFARGTLHGFHMPPRPTTTDDVGLVETNHGLGEGIVIRVALTPNGSVDPGLGEALGVANRQVLAGFKGLE